jgi:hypothetical protein
MGRIRGYAFDAVIGVGGIGQEPKNFGIARKLNWVGIGPLRQERLVAMNPLGQKSVRGFVLAFEKFLFLGKQGPSLHDLAPVLAKRMYEGKARFLLDDYSASEHAEANAILQWSLRQTPP